MKALANEIAKNLVLAGIGSLTVLDHERATETDLGAQFFLSAEYGHLGVNRAIAASQPIQRLNPRVKVSVDTDNIRTKAPGYFRPLDIVIATDLDPATLGYINAATRLTERPFYAAASHGLFGFLFGDLIEHDYVIERQEANVPTKLGPETRTRSVIATQTKTDGAGKSIELVTKRELYSPWRLASDAAALPAEYTTSQRRLRAVTPALPCLRALWQFQLDSAGRLPGETRDDLQRFTLLANQKHAALGLPAGSLRSEFLRSFLQNLGSEVAPVTAVLGGQLAQDVINVLRHQLQPIQNMVVFDGSTMEASMYPLHPEGPLGTKLVNGIPNGGAEAAVTSAAAVAPGPALPAVATPIDAPPVTAASE